MDEETKATAIKLRQLCIKRNYEEADGLLESLQEKEVQAVRRLAANEISIWTDVLDRIRRLKDVNRSEQDAQASAEGEGTGRS